MLETSVAISCAVSVVLRDLQVVPQEEEEGEAMSETKPCRMCDKLMVNVPTGVLLLTCPPGEQRTWWCDCGYRQNAPDEPCDQTPSFQQLWRKANGLCQT